MTAALMTFQARSVIRGRWSMVAILGFAVAAHLEPEVFDYPFGNNI